MKRHEAIAPLSRDHHGSLILAQLLKKNAPAYPGMPDTAKDKTAYALQQFATHIKKHFRQEELMLEKVKDTHPEIDKLAEEITADHSELTDLFQTLQSASNIEDSLDSLANKLEQHIRMEERILFPLLQMHCSEKKLQEIYDLLH